MANQTSASSRRPEQTMSKGVRLGIVLGMVLLAVGALLLIPAILRRARANLERPYMKKVASQLFDQPKVEIGGRQFTVDRVGPHSLHHVVFEVHDHTFEAIEQDPDKDTQWAKLAREGHKVVQFKDIAGKRYVGVVVDGDVRDTKPSPAD